MATQKPISTISYNTEAFLREKLDSWVESHIIQAYQYICHVGEDGDKNHIHVRVEPNKKLDPMDLSDLLKEYVKGNDKPLGVRPWRQSKEEDWYLYAVHDPDYLKLKYGGGDRGEKLPYQWQDIKVSDGYDLEIAYIRARAIIQHSSVNMAQRLQGGDNPLNLILEGENPYLVNAMARAMAGYDYQRISDELRQTRFKLHSLIQDIRKHGFDVFENDIGLLYLRQRFADGFIVDESTGEVLDESVYDGLASADDVEFSEDPHRHE